MGWADHRPQGGERCFYPAAVEVVLAEQSPQQGYGAVFQRQTALHGPYQLPEFFGTPVQNVLGRGVSALCQLQSNGGKAGNGGLIRALIVDKGHDGASFASSKLGADGV